MRRSNVSVTGGLGLALLVILWPHARGGAASNPVRAASSVEGAKSGTETGGLVALAPEASPGRNLVANPGFESGDASWSLSRCWSVDSSVAHSGSRSLRFEAGLCNAAPAVTLAPYDHPAVRSFTLRAWVRTSSGSDLQLRIALHDRSARGFILGATQFVSPGTDWQLLEKKDIDLPAVFDGHALEVSAVVHGSSGQAWFDDVEMVEQTPSAVEAFLLYPNFRGFLWSSGAQMIQLQVRTFGADAKKDVVQATLKSESGEAVRMVKHPAEPFSVIEMEGSRLARGSYRLETRLLDAQSGREIAAWPDYRITKVSDDFRDALVNYIGPDNYLVRKGKKVFVWGVYDRFSGRFRCPGQCLSSSAAGYEAIPGFDGKSTVDNYADTHLNAEINILPFVGVNFEENQLRPWLEALDKRGVGHLQIVNTWFNGSRGYPGWARSMSDDALWRKLAGAMKGQPGALGYYTFDEPQTDKLPAVFEQYKVLREEDPGSIAFGVLANCAQVFRWRDTSDAIGCDPYSVGFPLNAEDVSFGATSPPPMLRASVMTDETERQVSASRPVWMVLQLYRFNGQYPTYDQLKMQAYKAIIHGANGILWWGFVSERGMEEEWNLRGNHQAYADFKRLSDEVKALDPLLVAAPDPGILASVSDLGIETLVKRDGNKVMIFASNFGETAKSGVTLTLAPSANVTSSSVGVYSEGRSVAVAGKSGAGGATFRDDFGPYAVHVYELNLN